MVMKNEKLNIAEKRCAVYTRIAAVEDRDPASPAINAQREGVENYIRAQGGVVLPEIYDDSGISGLKADRPALTRLKRDIENGLIDVVIARDVARLSRSMEDFAKMMDFFEKHQVSFVDAA